jgi:hypothetical protein
VLLVMNGPVRVPTDPRERDRLGHSSAAPSRCLGARQPELVVELQRAKCRGADGFVVSRSELVENTRRKDAAKRIVRAHAVS